MFKYEISHRWESVCNPLKHRGAQGTVTALAN